MNSPVTDGFPHKGSVMQKVFQFHDVTMNLITANDKYKKLSSSTSSSQSQATGTTTPSAASFTWVVSATVAVPFSAVPPPVAGSSLPQYPPNLWRIAPYVSASYPWDQRCHPCYEVITIYMDPFYLYPLTLIPAFPPSRFLKSRHYRSSNSTLPAAAETCKQ